MRKSSSILLLLLAFFFSPRSISAQAAGALLIAIDGTPNGTQGTISVGFNDSLDNIYSGSYTYSSTDTPASVAAALASTFSTNYGMTAVSSGALLVLTLSPAELTQNSGNATMTPGVFYPASPGTQSMWPVLDGELYLPVASAPSSTISNPTPATNAQIILTANDDPTSPDFGSITVGTNTPPLPPGVVEVTKYTLHANLDGSETETTTLSDGTTPALTFDDVAAEVATLDVQGAIKDAANAQLAATSGNLAAVEAYLAGASEIASAVTTLAQANPDDPVCQAAVYNAQRSLLQAVAALNELTQLPSTGTSGNDAPPVGSGTLGGNGSNTTGGGGGGGGDSNVGACPNPCDESDGISVFFVGSIPITYSDGPFTCTATNYLFSDGSSVNSEASCVDATQTDTYCGQILD